MFDTDAALAELSPRTIDRLDRQAATIARIVFLVALAEAIFRRLPTVAGSVRVSALEDFQLRLTERADALAAELAATVGLGGDTAEYVLHIADSLGHTVPASVLAFV